MSIHEYLIVITIILFLIGLFADECNLVAYAICTYLILDTFEAHTLYKVLYALLIYPIIIFTHYKIIRRIILFLINTYIAKDKHTTGPKAIIGEVVIIKSVNHKIWGSVNGMNYSVELVHTEQESNTIEKDAVYKVEKVIDGKLIIKKH